MFHKEVSYETPILSLLRVETGREIEETAEVELTIMDNTITLKGGQGREDWIDTMALNHRKQGKAGAEWAHLQHSRKQNKQKDREMIIKCFKELNPTTA